MTCVCFGTRSDVFASASSEGAIKVWDLNNYSVLAETRVTAPGGARYVDLRSLNPELILISTPTPILTLTCSLTLLISFNGHRCMCWIGDTALVSGWEDYFVRYGYILPCTSL